MRLILKFFLILLFSFILFLVLVYFFVDPNVIISRLLPYVEKEYFLKLDYKLTEKTFYSLLSGVELRDVSIYSSFDGKMLSSSEKVKINFNFFTLFREPRAISISFYKPFINLGEINKFIGRKEVKEKFFNENLSSSTNVYFEILSISFDDAYLKYEKYNFNFDLILLFNPLKVEGFLNDTKSKFSFDGQRFYVDYIDLSKFVGDVKFSKVSANLLTNTYEISGKIGEVAYSTLVKVRDVNFSGNVSNLNLVFGFGEVLFDLDGKKFEITNIGLSFYSYTKGIKGKVELLKGLSGEFSYQDKFVFNFFLKDFSYTSLPYSVLGYISNVIKNFSLNGAVSLALFGDSFKVDCNIKGFVDTLVDVPLFRRFIFDLYVKENEGKAEVDVSCSNSSLKTRLLFSFSTNLFINEISLYSRVLYVSDIINTNVSEIPQSVVKKENNELSLPLVFGRVPIYFRIDNLYLPDGKSKLSDIYLTGNLTLKDGKFYLPIEVEKVSFYGILLSGEGDFSFSQDFTGKIEFSKVNVNLRDFYKNFDLMNMGGNVYGYGVITNLQILVNTNLSVGGILIISNVELIGLKIQNELTKLLNLDLEHIFVDSGFFKFSVDGGVSITGNVSGDIVSDFSLRISDKVKVKFNYLRVSRSLIENLPKFLFVGNEINGIKYKLDGEWLSFGEFEISF